jgi:RNA polymerase sigma factor for flagellar operon FliA
MRRPSSAPSPIPPTNATVVRAYFTEEEKEAMLERNLPVIRAVVDRMRIFLPAALDINDLYSVGFHGLINAVQKFDPTLGTVFAGFAALHIRGAVRDELRRMDWTPRSVRDKAKRVREALECLEQRLGRPAEEGEVARELAISLEEYWGLLDDVRPVSFVPLDEASSGEGSIEGLFHERVADESQDCPREALERKEIHELVLEQISKMPELPKKVLAMYYFENMRLSEIAAVYQLTEGRISQIHTQAVLSLRNFVKRLNNPILCS